MRAVVAIILCRAKLVEDTLLASAVKPGIQSAEQPPPSPVVPLQAAHAEALAGRPAGRPLGRLPASLAAWKRVADDAVEFTKVEAHVERLRRAKRKEEQDEVSLALLEGRDAASPNTTTAASANANATAAAAATAAEVSLATTSAGLGEAGTGIWMLIGMLTGVAVFFAGFCTGRLVSTYTLIEQGFDPDKLAGLEDSDPEDDRPSFGSKDSNLDEKLAKVVSTLTEARLGPPGAKAATRASESGAARGTAGPGSLPPIAEARRGTSGPAGRSTPAPNRRGWGGKTQKLRALVAGLDDDVSASDSEADETSAAGSRRDTKRTSRGAPAGPFAPLPKPPDAASSESGSAAGSSSIGSHHFQGRVGSSVSSSAKTDAKQPSEDSSSNTSNLDVQ